MARGRGKHTSGERNHKYFGHKSKGRKVFKKKGFKNHESRHLKDYRPSVGLPQSSDADGQNRVFTKRRKVEDDSVSRPSTRPVSKSLQESSDDGSVDEDVNARFNDPYNQLLSTFSTFNSNLRTKAIESDDSDEEFGDGGGGDNVASESDEASEENVENEDGFVYTDRSTVRPRHATKITQEVYEGSDSVEQSSDDSTFELGVGLGLGKTLNKPSRLKLKEHGKLLHRRTGICQENSDKHSNDNLSKNGARPMQQYRKRPRCSVVELPVVQGIEGDPESNDTKDDIDDSSDPFALHFYHDMDDSLYGTVSKEPLDMETFHQNWPVIGHFLVQLPKLNPSESNIKVPSTKIALLEEKKFTQAGSVPTKISYSNWSQLYIKPQIRKNISTANVDYVQRTEDASVPLSPLQRELFSLMHKYQDVCFPYRTLSNGEQVRFVYCLHAVNHILKTRNKIIHHNAKLAKKDDVPDEFRDQGLVRPKVVILVPFRESALRVVKLISNILFQEEKGSVMHMKRFVEEHSGEEIAMPKKNPRPEDYEATFVGNTDDTFRIGMTVTRKSLKLYADFYSADIIVASPLGLRMIVGAEGEAERDFDFLASVELLILDQAELFLMQNWDHLLHVLDHFHLQPKESHGTDFSRVRSWALNGWTQYYRQTLLFSSLLLPEISAVFNKKCHNYAGKIKVINPIPTGSICQVMVQLPQVFYRFDATSASQAIDARLDFFVKKILPQFKDTIMSHTMVYVPSYFDFVCLRNYFKREDIGFVQICEYSKDGKVARARDMFFHTDAHFLLYSERFHFFRRFRIKGIRHLIFYQPPTFPHFYSEMCNLMHEANQNKTDGNESNMTVTVLYSKYDLQQLAALVGTDRAKRMVSSERSVHMFMTGD